MKGLKAIVICVFAFIFVSALVTLNGEPEEQREARKDNLYLATEMEYLIGSYTMYETYGKPLNAILYISRSDAAIFDANMNTLWISDLSSFSHGMMRFRDGTTIEFQYKRGGLGNQYYISVKDKYESTELLIRKS